MRDLSVSNRFNLKPTAYTVIDSSAAGSSIRADNYCRSRAMRVSTAPPYNPPKTPHQNHREILLRICGSCQRFPRRVRRAARGMS